MEFDLTNLSKMIPPIFYPAFKFRGRFLILYGGSGSGKSYCAADKILVRMLKEDKHNILCVRDTGKSVTKSQFPLIEGEIKRWGLSDYFTINRSMGNEKIIFKPKGNQIIFSGLDDVEKLKSIYDVTSIWIEEANEITPEDFRELNRRLRGYTGKNRDGSPKYMQIMLTFNPISELSWLKQRFFDNPEDTLILYGTEQVRNFKGDVNKYGTYISHSTYKDNPFIDEAYAKEMEELKKYDEAEYNIYALGLWGIPGGTYFDKANVAKRILEERTKYPLKQGYFEFDYVNDKIVDDSIRWVEDKSGYIKIYEEPQKGFPYVGGGDTSGDGSDWNTGAFTNNVTKTDVAFLKINFDEDLYARQMYCLGRYYNFALLGIETNFSTHPVKELQRLGYPNQYVREETPDAFTGRLTKKFGFITNKLTRPVALGMLRTVMREHPERVKDLDTLNEMTTFVKNEKGKPEAASGFHDDCIMARAINCYIASQQLDHPKIDADERPKKLAEKLGIKKFRNGVFVS
jgi:phage terminase large subunit